MSDTKRNALNDPGPVPKSLMSDGDNEFDYIEQLKKRIRTLEVENQKLRQENPGNERLFGNRIRWLIQTFRHHRKSK